MIKVQFVNWDTFVIELDSARLTGLRSYLVIIFYSKRISSIITDENVINDSVVNNDV